MNGFPGSEAVAVLLGAGALAAAACLAIAGIAARFGSDAHRIGERFGDEPATVTEWSGRTGRVSVAGEDWGARASETLVAGDRVDVVKAQGLTLLVRKAQAKEITGE